MLGKRSLETAARESNVKVKIIYHPYIINSNVPLVEGEDMRNHILTKSGSEAVERYFRPDNPLEMAGHKVGISFNLSRRMINSIPAHRLTLWCQATAPEKNELLIDSLFYAYNVEAKDISNTLVLAQIAEQVGLSGREAQCVLQSSAFLQELLDKDVTAKHRMRVSGVPFFTIGYQNRRRPFSFAGAQPLEAMVNILKEAAQTV